MNIKHEYPGGKSIKDREITFYDRTEFKEDFDMKEVLGEVKKFFADARDIVGPEGAAELAKHPLVSFVTKFLGENRLDHITKK